jgi:hypothetical protein
MLQPALLTHGSPEVLEEIPQLLSDVNVPSEPGMLIANSADAGAFHILSVATGAGLALIAPARTASNDPSR